MNILLVLLGCNVPYLLNDRIATAVKFSNRFNNESVSVDWFLSGGIKNPAEDTVTEAEKMASQISQYAPDNWNYIYDTVATNTAENFIMVKQYLDETHIDYLEVFVVTSDFHYVRASKIAEKIIGTRELGWVLSEAELHDSRYWEKIHIKNVDADVNKALRTFPLINILK